MKILLLDMDGVLLEPHGYHRALQETVAQLGRLLGYREIRLTPQEIVAFEAAGVSSEWDSAAICAALLLERVWTRYPDLAPPLGPPLWGGRAGEGLDAPRHDLSPPDFRAFADILAQVDEPTIRPLQRAEVALLARSDSRTPAQRELLRNVLRQARGIEGSLTHRIFQELVLGSRVFAQTYALPPTLETESYLLQFDRPLLPDAERDRLLRWLEPPPHRAVIFTSRPSRPVGDASSTPEAEIGAQRVGLVGIPILGLGGLLWLSKRLDRDPEELRKPSPIHSLAALRLALDPSLEKALTAAADLALRQRADATWGALRGAQVFLFEDTASGMESVVATRDILERIDVPIQLHLFGITDQGPKRRALKALGARVLPTLADGLERVTR